MKIYKTWEVYNPANEEKQFKRNSDGLIFKFLSGYLVPCSKEGEEYDCINIDDEWTLAQQPVDFMTAALSGKRIRVEHDCLSDGSWFKDFHCMSFLFEALSVFSSEFIKKLIENGKWYIEEE